MLFAAMTLVEDPEPHGAAENMALDEVLLERAEGPLLRYYQWARPAVSFGCFGRWEEVARDWPAREAVRRWTGGGVVLHGEDFTYSLVVPRGHDLAGVSPAESYRLIHEALALALGGAARLMREAAARVSPACFDNPVVSDVMAGGRKAAGAAQRRTAKGLLHQGSVQGADGRFGERLISALADRTKRRGLDKAELSRGRELARIKYASLEWMRRLPTAARALPTPS